VTCRLHPQSLERLFQRDFGGYLELRQGDLHYLAGFRFSPGDLARIINPNVTALIRAGDLADRATFYRHDLAFPDNPGLPTNPHRFLVATDVAAFRPIALAAQAQIATFFASDGTLIIQPPGVPEEFFEVPIVGPLPEDLNYVFPPSPPGAPAAPVAGSHVSGPTPVDPPAGSLALLDLLPPVPLGGSAAGPGAFELVRQEGGVVQLDVSEVVVDGHSVDTLTFTAAGIIGGSLADGHYTLTIHGGLVHDGFGQALDGASTGVAGSDRTDTFFRLFGDADGEGHVDLGDLLHFANTFGKHAGVPGYLWYFDYDGDGRVDLGDLLQLLRRLG
jgi:hypothetical protein